MADGARRRILELGTSRGTPLHFGSALSALEIMAVSASVLRPGEDDFVLSKGHAALGWYAVLAERGDLEPDTFPTYGRDARLSVHPHRGSSPATTFSTGSLGHGIALATGSCLGRSLLGRSGQSHVLMGDGECQEGSVWEAAAFAADRKASGLTVIVDANGFNQNGALTGSSSCDGLAKQFAALGWQTQIVAGHDTAALSQALLRPAAHAPHAVIARTRKGHGCPQLVDAMPGAHFTSLPGG